tara:strand:+ start:7815 stop:8222 length:408 start_codon:yes stop_codon:yes gene_type:complete
MEKLIFASKEWIDRARMELKDLVGLYGEEGIKFSLCEVFTDAPKTINPSGTVSWYFCIDGKTVTVATGVYDSANIMIRTDYQKVLAQARTIYTDEYLAARAKEPAGSQFDYAEGDFSATPSYINELHNRLARITA